MTKEKLKDDLDWMDAPIEAKQWKNWWFLHSGESFWGFKIFSSEAAAIADQRFVYDMHGQPRAFNPDSRNVPATNQLGRDVFMGEISHAIAMPVPNA